MSVFFSEAEVAPTCTTTVGLASYCYPPAETVRDAFILQTPNKFEQFCLVLILFLFEGGLVICDASFYWALTRAEVDVVRILGSDCCFINRVLG